VALAWLLTKPGVTSPILGATSVAQLDDNLASLDVKLSPEQVKALDAASAPQLNFPAAFLSRAGSFMHGGITVNGDSAVASAFGPKPDSKIW
jgi:diketogulonate reductase-like aldo/keto reductase